jgi:excisionase family DNA binding protein
METKTQDASERGWLTVPDLAKDLNIPRSRAYELIQRGELPAVRVGERSIRVNRRELERFLLETRQVVAR